MRLNYNREVNGGSKRLSINFCQCAATYKLTSSKWTVHARDRGGCHYFVGCKSLGLVTVLFGFKFVVDF